MDITDWMSGARGALLMATVDSGADLDVSTGEVVEAEGAVLVLLVWRDFSACKEASLSQTSCLTAGGRSGCFQ